VFLVGYYGVRNLGDEQIRVAIEGAADRLGVRIRYWATRSRERVDDPHAVRFSPGGMLRYLHACASVDRVVLGGGGILKDEGLRLPLELLVTALAARATGRPVTLLAVGVGPFYTVVGRWMVKAIARLASVRTVRDQASADALRALGVTNVIVGADPIFSLPGVADDPAPAAELGDRPGTAIVSLRPWFHKDANGGRDRWAGLSAAMASALDSLAEAGWQIRFVSLYWPRDREAGDDVRRLMRHGAEAALDEHPVTWDELCNATDAAGLVLAMRYHALAAAVLRGRPAIAVAYEPKVRSLADEVGVTLVDVDDARIHDSLRDAVARAMRDPGSTRPAADRVAGLQERAQMATRAALPAPGAES
jgi:polysaccharide pyruvyl transferase CsaB